MKKRLYFLAVILLSAALFLYLRMEKAARLDVQFSGESFFEGLKIVNKKDGATDWVLTARRADFSGDGNEALLSGVEMHMESQGMTLSSEKALYNMDTRKVSVDGEIKAQNKNYVMTTSQALIDSGGGTIETAGDVKVEGKKFHLEGRGMKADNNEQKVRILKNVKATFNR
jgi:LPS export ABC transporter protein LptC